MTDRPVTHGDKYTHHKLAGMTVGDAKFVNRSIPDSIQLAIQKYKRETGKVPQILRCTTMPGQVMYITLDEVATRIIGYDTDAFFKSEMAEPLIMTTNAGLGTNFLTFTTCHRAEDDVRQFVKKPMMDALNDLFDEKQGLLDGFLAEMFARLEKAVEDPSKIINETLSRIFNEIVFNGRFHNFDEIMQHMQKALKKMLPKTAFLRKSPNLPTWQQRTEVWIKRNIAGILSLGMKSIGEFINKHLYALVLEAYKKPMEDFGIISRLIGLGKPPEELTVHLHSFLEGLLETLLYTVRSNLLLWSQYQEEIFSLNYSDMSALAQALLIKAPAAPVNIRFTVHDMVIGNETVPANTMMVVGLKHTVERMIEAEKGEDYTFKDIFDLCAEGHKIAKYADASLFGMGPATCVGKSFAKKLSLALCQHMHKNQYRVHLTHPENMHYIMDLAGGFELHKPRLFWNRSQFWVTKAA